MEINFHCPGCRQELAVDASGAGTNIDCPSCGKPITIPQADASNIRVGHATDAAHKEEKHFSVPVHEGPTEMLVKKKEVVEEIRPEGQKTVKVKCIKHTECVEVGRDRYEEVVSNFLAKVGEKNIITINPINYTHMDMGTRMLMTEYGVMIVYKG